MASPRCTTACAPSSRMIPSTCSKVAPAPLSPMKAIFRPASAGWVGGGGRGTRVNTGPGPPEVTRSRRRSTPRMAIHAPAATSRATAILAAGLFSMSRNGEQGDRPVQLDDGGALERHRQARRLAIEGVIAPRGEHLAVAAHALHRADEQLHGAGGAQVREPHR